jgi:hypothetical protein
LTIVSEPVSRITTPAPALFAPDSDVVEGVLEHAMPTSALTVRPRATTALADDKPTDNMRTSSMTAFETASE